jgi:hypothetical protein
MDGVDRILNVAPIAGFNHPVKQAERTDADAHKRQEPDAEREKGDVLELHVVEGELEAAIALPDEGDQESGGLDLAV